MNSAEIDNALEIKISQLAEILDVSPSTLRYYELEHLVTPSRLESSNYRKYSLLQMIELSDVLLYRNMDISVKEIKTLLESPIEESVSAIDTAAELALQEIDRLNHVLMDMTHWNRNIRKYFSLRGLGYRVVEKPEVKYLYAFHLDDPKQMRQYVKNHHAFPYAVYVADPRHPEIFEDCVIRSEPRKGEELLWKFSDDKRSYLECIVRTEYAYSDQNDLPEHIDYMRKQGLDPGCVIMEYLTFDYSEEDKKRYDYYRAWIEILT